MPPRLRFHQREQWGGVYHQPFWTTTIGSGPGSRTFPPEIQPSRSFAVSCGINRQRRLTIGRSDEIPVLVRTTDGEMTADNIQQSNFEVFEDNVAQNILLFKHEDPPIRIGMVLNTVNIAERRERIDCRQRAIERFPRLPRPPYNKKGSGASRTLLKTSQPLLSIFSFARRP